MVEHLHNNINNIKIYQNFYSEKNIKKALLKALANEDFDFNIYKLKRTGQTIIRYKWDNLRTNIFYDKWKCRIDAEIFWDITTFEWEDIDIVWDEYDKWCKLRSVKYPLYKSPDWTVGSYSFFKKEILQWHFHWCTIWITPKSKK